MSPAVGRSALQIGRSSATAHASTAVILVSHTVWLIRVVGGLPAEWFQSWCSVSCAHCKLQSCMCRCAVWQVTDMPKDGMTMSGCAGEYLEDLCCQLYIPIGDKTKSFHLMPRIRFWYVMWNCLRPPRVFFQQCPGFSAIKAENTCSIDSELGSKTQQVLTPDSF